MLIRQPGVTKRLPLKLSHQPVKTKSWYTAKMDRASRNYNSCFDVISNRQISTISRYKQRQITLFVSYRHPFFCADHSNHDLWASVVQ